MQNLWSSKASNLDLSKLNFDQLIAVLTFHNVHSIKNCDCIDLAVLTPAVITKIFDCNPDVVRKLSPKMIADNLIHD